METAENKFTNMILALSHKSYFSVLSIKYKSVV
jgi:hypothetical protein